jgi:hypothetical protein
VKTKEWKKMRGEEKKQEVIGEKDKEKENI